MLSRIDRSLLSRWWWSVDRITLLIFILLMSLGIILSFAATPTIAKRFGLEPFYFVKRHLLYMIPTFFILITVSMLRPVQIRKLSFLLLIVGLFLLFLTPFIGVEIKGAKRWIMILGNSFQISEFVKPAFCVISGWLLAKQFHDRKFPGLFLSLLLTILIIFFLLLQPDLGMVFIFLSLWFTQLFIAGLPYLWIFTGLIFMPIGLIIVYLIFPHVARRIDLFFHAEESYQVTRSLEGFVKGGLFGQGPAEGVIKYYVPDAHSDFIFSVAGEEFGFFFCLMIIGIFAILIYHITQRLYQSSSIFTVITTTGLLSQFILQSLINIASTLGLIPTKGMTLPFISYGGSSMLALALSCSMILSLTRKQSDFDTTL